MKVKSDTVARTAVLFIALVNQFLAASGREVLPFADDEVYQCISVILTLIASAAAWWKNNSFTKSAIEADKYMEKLKEGNGNEESI